MTLFAAIPVMIVIGWAVPRAVVRRMRSRWSVLWGAVAALALGAGLIFAAAEAVEALGLGEARAEREAALNAWKIMLLLAPAAALDARRRQSGDGG